MKGLTQKEIENFSPTSFFNDVYTVFKKTEETVGQPLERFYDLAGFTICLQFAGQALLSLITPALEHLATPAVSSPSLTICLFDSLSTSAKMPLFPWKINDNSLEGDKEDNSVKASYNIGRGILSLLNTKLNIAIYWTKDYNAIPWYELGCPLIPIFHWWLLGRGRQFAHGAAIGTSKGGVLLVGKSGSGKSTTALACLDSELFFAGDDYVSIGNDPEPFVYSLYNSAKVERDNLKKLLTNLSNLSYNNEELVSQKALFFLNKYFPEKMIKGFPCRAILLPSVSGLKETKITKISPILIFKSLVPNTIFQLNTYFWNKKVSGETDLKNFSRFIKQLPCYSIEVGTDLSLIPLAILELLSQLEK